MTRLVVFSHPNHELAIFGLLQRHRPHLLYLTDGGGEDRVAQTRQGLDSIGLVDRARFLNHPEQSFYAALLARDTNFFAGIAREVRACIDDVKPDAILCDAVEFYNPVHDMSLPITWAAQRGPASEPVFEIPLIYQQPVDGEVFACQRWPASRRAGQVELQLSGEELDAKISARDTIYTILVGQLGATIVQLPRPHLALEVIGPARASVPEPSADCVLRYERRARILAAKGEITREITYRDHYVPVATSLLRA